MKLVGIQGERRRQYICVWRANKKGFVTFWKFSHKKEYAKSFAPSEINPMLQALARTYPDKQLFEEDANEALH